MDSTFRDLERRLQEGDWTGYARLARLRRALSMARPAPPVARAAAKLRSRVNPPWWTHGVGIAFGIAHFDLTLLKEPAYMRQIPMIGSAALAMLDAARLSIRQDVREIFLTDPVRPAE